MKIQSLGHVVIKVRDRKRVETFYGDLLGLPICASDEKLGMTFFSLGDHHDFAVAAVGDDAPTAPAGAVGLAHVAFKIGESVDDLREAREHLAAAGVEARAVDHEVSKSLYFADPDGNVVELYVDASDVWKREPQRVAQSRPLQL